MNIKKYFSDLIFKIRFTEISNQLVSKSELFTLDFPNDWVYSKSGNSFYSFHNIKEDLKGGLQMSLHWNVDPPDGASEYEAIMQLINREETHEVKPTKQFISGYDCVYYFSNTDDSNMDFHHWIIFKNKILVIFKFMIFEEESEETKSRWFDEVNTILSSLVINEDQFRTTRMR